MSITTATTTVKIVSISTVFNCSMHSHSHLYRRVRGRHEHEISKYPGSKMFKVSELSFDQKTYYEYLNRMGKK